MEITKEAFEQFVALEFPRKKYHFDYKNEQGYMQIQAKKGKEFSINDMNHKPDFSKMSYKNFENYYFRRLDYYLWEKS